MCQLAEEEEQNRADLEYHVYVKTSVKANGLQPAIWYDVLFDFIDGLRTHCISWTRALYVLLKTHDDRVPVNAPG